MSNVLDLVDQAAFLAERAAGSTNLVQVVWVYDRAVDIEGLRTFHRHLGHGRLSRRIERSPLPFGRHRWVTPATQSELEIVSVPRPRQEFDAWIDQQTNTPLDAENGPGWHLAVLPFTDGGAGVSLVTSHVLADGLGLCEGLADAASGRHDPIAWPAAGARRRWRALREDARQILRDLPAMGRAVGAAIRFGRATRPSPAPRSPLAGPDRPVSPPTATIFVDADEWDARAAALGGSSSALLAALTAGLARRAGRIGDDGLAIVAMPVNERSGGDTRANAITAVDIAVDPAAAATDLRPIRSALKQALTTRREFPDERWALLPLTPLIPQWLVRRMAGAALGGSTTSGSSHVGAVDPAAGRADGTDADYFFMRTLYPGVSEEMMHQTGGMLGLASGRMHGRVFVSIYAYQPGRPNSVAGLWADLAGVLGDFALTTGPGWARPDALNTMRKT